MTPDHLAVLEAAIDAGNNVDEVRLVDNPYDEDDPRHKVWDEEFSWARSEMLLAEVFNPLKEGDDVDTS